MSHPSQRSFLQCQVITIPPAFVLSTMSALPPCTRSALLEAAGFRIRSSELCEVRQAGHKDVYTIMHTHQRSKQQQYPTTSLTNWQVLYLACRHAGRQKHGKPAKCTEQMYRRNVWLFTMPHNHHHLPCSAEMAAATGCPTGHACYWAAHSCCRHVLDGWHNMQNLSMKF